MSYANRHNDLKSFFHRSDGYISEVVETVRKHLQSIAFNLLNSFDEERVRPWMPIFAAAIADKGSPLR